MGTELHPTFASGEDRNYRQVAQAYSEAVLHPTFASGEDRNMTLEEPTLAVVGRLHPTFASGEDRNCSTRCRVAAHRARAAPDVRVG